MPSDKSKKDMAKKLGSGGVKKAAMAFINRDKQIDDIVRGSAGKKGK